MISDSPRLVPDRLRPFALTSSRQAIAGTGAAVILLGAILWVDHLLPRPGVATLTLIPVLGAVWLLPRLAATLVVTLALADRIAAAVLGEIGLVALVSESLALLVIAGVGRVAATYVEATARAAGRAQLVARVARIATSADSIEKILDQILKEMAREGLRGGMVGLINENNEIYPAAAEGDLDAAVWNSRLPVGQGIMGAVAADGRSILIRDLDSPDNPVRAANRNLGSNSRIKSLVATPLLSGGRVIGVLELDSSRPNRFGPADLEVLEQISLAISDAVQREGALQLADFTLRQRVQELTLLLEAARRLAASLEPAVVLETVVETLTLSMRSQGGQASLIRIEGDRLTTVTEHDGNRILTRKVDLPIGFAPSEMLKAIEAGHAYGCRRDAMSSSLADLLSPSAVAFAWAPVRVGGQLYGVVTANSESAPFEWSSLRMLEGIADLSGLAIGNAERLRLELERTAELRAHADRMAELEKVKSDFLKVASHELRGPLGVLKGYVSMLADGSLTQDNPASPRVLEIVGEKLQEVSTLVEQMLETARLEDSRLHLKLAVVDLQQILAQAAERTQDRVTDGHRLRLANGAGAVPVRVDGDRMVTIVANLIDNALKYSPDGGDVSCSVTQSEGRALLNVTDAGVGIDAADLPRLFTRFGRIVTAENSHIQGTGLGLYLARELARMHGGDITVESAPGRGSRFTLSLPAAKLAELEADLAEER
ncbi:MAG: hypothetical protein NVS9B1_07580 [Candidatus Dormibacteraceae bacterium]